MLLFLVSPNPAISQSYLLLFHGHLGSLRLSAQNAHAGKEAREAFLKLLMVTVSTEIARASPHGPVYALHCLGGGCLPGSVGP